MVRASALRLCQQALLARSAQAAQLRAVAGSRAAYFSSLPEPVDDGSLPNSKDGKVLHPDLLNENMLKVQYAVRGELFLMGEQLRSQGRDIISTNGAFAFGRRAVAWECVRCARCALLALRAACCPSQH